MRNLPTCTYSQRGIILITTMLLLALLSMLMLAQIQLLFLYTKGLNNLRAKDRLFYQLETVAQSLLHSDQLNKPKCLIQELGSNEALDYLKKNNGCRWQQQKQQYFYINEQLGLFSCLLAFVDQKKYSTRHWRLTVMTTQNIAQPPTDIFLQLRFVTLAPFVACDNHNVVREINPGILSWRHLTAVTRN